MQTNMHAAIEAGRQVHWSSKPHSLAPSFYCTIAGHREAGMGGQVDRQVIDNLPKRILNCSRLVKGVTMMESIIQVDGLLTACARNVERRC
jgi:hypothetical protein